MLLHRSQGVSANAIAGLAPAAWFRYGRGITVTGAGVSQWDDASGNARHLKQGTDTNRPALQADNTILFDGVDNFLKCDAFTLNQPETVYLLGKQVAWAISTYVFDGNASASMGFQGVTASPQRRLVAGSATAANADWVVGTYAAVACVFNGASSLIQVNSGTPSTGGDSGATNAGGFTLGVNGAVASGFSNIQVKEVIIFSGAHDAARRSLVQQYLAAVNAQ